MSKPARSFHRSQVPVPALVLGGCLAVACLIMWVFSPSSEESASGQTVASPTVPSQSSTATARNDTTAAEPNGHVVGVKGQEPVNGDRQLVALPADAPKQGELKDRLGQLVAAYYGRDALEVTGRENLDCTVSDTPTQKEVSRITEELRPLIGQLQQLRDSRLDQLVTQGVINDTDETPVLQALKSDPVERDWLTRCSLFSTEGLVTATTDFARLQATPRPDRDDGIYRVYIEVPVSLTFDMRTIKTATQLDTPTLVLRTEWYYQHGHWVVMSYTPI